DFSPIRDCGRPAGLAALRLVLRFPAAAAHPRALCAAHLRDDRGLHPLSTADQGFRRFLHGRAMALWRGCAVCALRSFPPLPPIDGQEARVSDVAVGDRPVDPRRYFESVARERGEIAKRDPVCLYLETTNRCNLPCTTCPRTFEELEPAANMSWDLFRSIVDQYPAIARVVRHGVGEPLMVPNLPRMIKYLKERGTYVLFNTNGTLLNERRGRDLIASGLDELRVSLDAAEPAAFKAVRGKDAFDRIVKNVREFRALQKSLDAEKPRVSLWLTGLKETIGELPAFVDLAADLDVPEVHLQRM